MNRFELKANNNSTYSIRDNLFGGSETFDSYEYARQRTDELNKKHMAEIAYYERRFL